jgi:hypothetical protein
LVGADGADGYDGADGALAPVTIPVALSPNDQAIASGAGKGFAPVDVAGTITAFRVQCDPNNEPDALSVVVDLNKVNLTTGALTSVCSTKAIIATGANSGSAVIDGTPAVSPGDWLQIDVDAGSDGKELIGIITITPTP